MSELLLSDLVESDGFSESNFAHLEKEYMQVLNELAYDQNVGVYLDGYTALFDRVYAENERTMELEREQHRLTIEVDVTERQLLEAMTRISENAHIRAALQEEVLITHEHLDAALAHEQIAMETIDNMKHTLASLQDEIEFRSRMEATSMDDENPTVARHRQGLERELEKLNAEVFNINTRVTTAVEQQMHMEEQSDLADTKIHQLTAKFDVAAVELTKSHRIRERLVENLDGITAIIAETDDELAGLRDTEREAETVVSQLVVNVFDSNQSGVRCLQGKQQYRQYLNDANEACNKQRFDLLTAKSEYNQLQSRLNERLRDLAQLRIAAATYSVEKAAALRRCRLNEQETKELGTLRMKLRGEVALLEREATANRLTIDVGRREIIERIHERDLVRSYLKRELLQTEDNNAVIRLGEMEEQKQEHTICEYTDNADVNHSYMMFLRHERDQLRQEITEKTQQLEELVGDARIRQHEMYKTRRLQFESVTRMRRQENAFDAIKSELMTVYKMVDDLGAVSTDLRMKVHDLETTNALLRSVLATKDAEMTDSELSNLKICNSTKAMRKELIINREQISQMRASIAMHKVLTKELLQQIDEYDFKMRTDDKVISTIVNETELLGGQLVVRNMELINLGVAMDMLQQMMAYGEAKYSQRLDDIRVLRKEIACLTQLKSVYSKDISNVTDFMAEALKLDKDLIRMRIKNKAMSQEIGKPLNIHPWSKMECSDPEKFQLIRRIFFMQKDILYVVQHLNCRKLQLRELRTMYDTLKHMMAKQPGKDFASRKQMLEDRLKEDECVTQHLKSTVKKAEDGHDLVRFKLHNVQLELHHASQELSHMKTLRTKTARNRHRLEQQIQAKLDQMAKIMSDKTIEAILKKICNGSDNNLSGPTE